MLPPSARRTSHGPEVTGFGVEAHAAGFRAQVVRGAHLANPSVAQVDGAGRFRSSHGPINHCKLGYNIL